MARHGAPVTRVFSAAAYALWLCVRHWPFGIHNLLPGIVAAGFAMLFGAVDTRQEFLSWERHAYVSTLLSWTVAGMFDCALLLRLLPRRHGEQGHVDAVEGHADTV
ncbi:MAG TPA: hypothetical protein VNJ04_06355 [Gemmatimonadaceae bacterium]|nr:hypothetical protein [Gemmatimonadaceae bacterium]